MGDLLEPSETPLIQSLRKGPSWTVPDFCMKTKKQEVEPYMGIYRRLLDIIDLATPESDEWGEWNPSEALKNLRKLAFDLGQSAYQETDNPTYNEDQCLKWKESNPGFAQSKVYWGTREWGLHVVE